MELFVGKAIEMLTPGTGIVYKISNQNYFHNLMPIEEIKKHLNRYHSIKWEIYSTAKADITY
jgi:hypothetical protein